MRGRVVVLGVDGLEYNLVEEWNLKYIKQKSFCKTDLSDFDVIVTPPIWSAMITGRIDERVVNIFKERLRRENSLWWNLLSRLLPRPIKAIYWKYIYTRFDLNPFDRTKDYNLGKETIFDFLKDRGIMVYPHMVEMSNRKRYVESL